MPGRFASGLMALCAAALPSLAAALPVPPRPGSAAVAVPVLLVCAADGCRHRFKAYRARPSWNGYWARQAEEDAPAAVRPTASRARR